MIRKPHGELSPITGGEKNKTRAMVPGFPQGVARFQHPIKAIACEILERCH